MATISRPDSTTEKFTNDQESGWTNSGTSASPAAATLLAQSRRHLHEPQRQHDDHPARLAGPGPARQHHRRRWATSSSMTATPTAWPRWPWTRSIGTPSSPTTRRATSPRTSVRDGNSESYTYNSDSQPLTFTDANGNTTSFTYSGGNLTVVEDPLVNLTSMTYTATGRLQDDDRRQQPHDHISIRQPGPADHGSVPGRHDQSLFVQFPGKRDQDRRRPE